jgi:hypothetical protein
LNEKELKLLKRRQSIEPTIGHLKQDHQMGRCHLRGETGDRIHAALCAAGYNIRWLLRMILKKGIGPFLCLIFLLVVSLISAAVRVDHHGWSMPQGADFGLLRLENEYFRDDQVKPGRRGDRIVAQSLERDLQFSPRLLMQSGSAE